MMTESVLNQSKTTEREPRPRPTKLKPVEAEIIMLFVQLSHALGHPCKIYNILQVGSPVLYIGPVPSHISEIANAADEEFPYLEARDGEAEKLVEHILRALAEPNRFTRRTSPRLQSLFAKEALLPKLIAELESA